MKINRAYRSFKRWVFDIIHPAATHSTVAVLFDVLVMAMIVASVMIVFAMTFELDPNVLGTMEQIEKWIVMVFTVEYLLRIWTADLLYPEAGWFRSRVKYVFSPMALVDLLAIAPFYLPVLLPKGMLGIRSLRLVRLLRIFKLNRHFDALAAIGSVVRDKATDLLAVLFFMLLMVLFLSLLLFAAEHDSQPDQFPNAVASLWWAIETFTKAGARNAFPVTVFGRILGSVISVLGVCLIAIPTGIISSGLIEHINKRKSDETRTTHVK